MLFSITLGGLLAAVTLGSANPLLQDRAVCNADNCARVVTGTRAGLPSTRLADCSSFMLATVTPAPVYTTTTVTVTTAVAETSTITTNPVFETTTVVQSTYTIIRTNPSSSSTAAAVNRRSVVESKVTTPTTVSPTAVPGYAASACSASSRYSSACSCAGVTRSTTTAAAPTSVATETVATTATTEVYVAATTTVEQVVVSTQITATKTGYVCGSSVQGNGIYSFRYYQVHCGQRVASGNVNSTGNYGLESDCLRACNSVKYCVYAEYQFSTGNCDLYYESPTAIVDDDDRDALVLS